MQFTPLAFDNRAGIEIKGTGPSMWDEVLEEAHLQQIALEGALQQTRLVHPSGEEMQQQEPELDARLAALPDEKQMVLAGIADALTSRNK